MMITVISSGRVVATSPPLFSLKSAQQLHTKHAHPLLIVSMYQQLPSWFDNDDSNDDHYHKEDNNYHDVDNDDHHQQQP